MEAALQLPPHDDVTWPFVPKPAKGEHVLGYVRRLVDANDFDTMRALWTALGIAEIAPVSPPSSWRRLQAITGLEPEYIERLRWPSIDGRRLVSFMGEPTRKQHLVVKRLRFCPGCFRDDHILRAPWSIYHVTACPLHEARLIDTCGECGSKLLLVSKTGIWECRSCGTDFRQQQAKPAQPEEIAFAQIIESKWRGDALAPIASLHPDIWSMSINQLVSVVAQLGAVAATSPEIDEPSTLDRQRYLPADIDQSPGVEGAATITIAGSRIIMNWPSAYHALLTSLLDRNPSPTQRNALRRRFATVSGLAAIRPILDHDRTPVEIVLNEFKRYASERLGYLWGQRDLNASREAQEASSAEQKKTGKRPAQPISCHEENIVHPVEAMRLLEGNGAAKHDVWVRSGLLSPRTGYRTSFYRRDIEKLVQRLGDVLVVNSNLDNLTRFGALRSDLIERTTAYSKVRLLQDIYSGKVTIYATSKVSSLEDVWLCEDEVEARAVVLKLEKMLAEDAYVRLSKANEEFIKLWGPMAGFGITEAHRYLALGRIRFRVENVKYKNAVVPRYRYHVGDLIAVNQSMFRPRYFEIGAETGTVEETKDEPILADA